MTLVIIGILLVVLLIFKILRFFCKLALWPVGMVFRVLFRR